MALDLKGIHQFTEDDDETTFSESLNLLAGSVSDALAWLAGTTAERDALEPAPPGAMWQDTDGAKRLWSCGPVGEWRLHEGTAVIPAGALGAAGNIYGRTLDIDIPTVIGTDETIMVAVVTMGGASYSWVTVREIARHPAKTTIGLRHMSVINGAHGFTISWRVVKGAA